MGIRRVWGIRPPASYIIGVQHPRGKASHGLPISLPRMLRPHSGIFGKFFLSKMATELLRQRTPVRRPPKTTWSHSGRPHRRLGAGMDEDALLTFCLPVSACSCIISHPPSSSFMGHFCFRHCTIRRAAGPQLCQKIPYAALLTQVILLSLIPSPHVCHDDFMMGKANT